MTQPDATQLHAFLVDHFNVEELKTLCFNLGIEYEDLGGEGRSDKARELVKAMQRRTRLEHLVAHLALARPEAYRKRFHETPSIPAAPARVRRNLRQVFISHAHQDAAFAQRLAGDLRARGFPVWIAPDSIRVGEQWPEAINRGLEESGVVVVALTPHALVSSWVQRETYAAINLEGRGRISFIPLDVVDCEPPILWSTYQFAPFRQSYARGLNHLLARLGGTPNRRIHEKTGIELIRIPAGPFLYGSADSDELAWIDEKPQRTVNLPEYWIGRAPVTNDQFARFVQATGHRTTAEIKGKSYGWTGSKWDWIAGADWRHPRGPESSIEGKDDHPVVQVSWEDAKAFCDWAGLALPAEEQWEKAARGTDGRIWPWGNEPPTAEHCNFNANVGDTTPVGRYSPQGDSPYGCVDMAGNVWEWTASWYDQSQRRRVLRGGSWFNLQRSARVSFRNLDSPVFAYGDLGIRPVAPVVSGS